MDIVTQQPPPSAGRRGPPKRVARACEYCRRKRLKCTANEVPCMNCRLYDEPCTYAARDTRCSPRAAAKRTGQKTRRITEPITPLSLSPCSPVAPVQTQLANGIASNQFSMIGIPGQVEDLYMPTAMPNQYMEAVPSGSPWPHEFPHVVSEQGAGPLLDNEFSNPSITSIFGYPTPELGEVPLATPTCHNQALEAQYQSEALANDPGLPLQESPDNGKPLGSTATASIVSTFLNMSGVDPEVLHRLQQGTEHTDEAYQSSIFPTIAPEQVLASPEYVQRSVAAYIDNVHIHYPIVELQQLENWRERYRPLDVPTDWLHYSRLCLVVSIGALSLDPTEDHAGPQQDRQERAWGLIMATLASPSIEAVEVLLLHIVHLMYTGRSGTAWLVSGLVIRIGESLGLHQDSQAHEPGIGEKQMLRRKGLWQMAYSLDAFLSLAEGRPPATTDHPDDPGLNGITFSEHDTGDMTLAEVHLWRVQLARIANRASSLLNRGAMGLSVLDDLALLDQELTHWRDSIPMEYRPDQRILATGGLYSAVALLHLQYYNLMQTVHAVSYTISLQKANPGLLAQCAPRIRCSESICLVAARSIIETLNQALVDMDQKGRFIGIPVFYCMAAIAVIFRQILSHPSAISARILLEYLRGGTLHILQTVLPEGPMDHFRALSESLKVVAEVNVDGGTR